MAKSCTQNRKYTCAKECNLEDGRPQHKAARVGIVALNIHSSIKEFPTILTVFLLKMENNECYGVRSANCFL